VTPVLFRTPRLLLAQGRPQLAHLTATLLL
jgi:hypothetical protein